MTNLQFNKLLKQIDALLERHSFDEILEMLEYADEKHALRKLRAAQRELRSPATVVPIEVTERANQEENTQ